MPRAKRSSPVLEAARQRLAGLKSINPAPNFGEGLSLAAYETEINAFSVALDSYNQELSGLNDRLNTVTAVEDALREKSRRMLKLVEGNYGPDSSEFEQAGGKRVSKHKSRRRKSAPNEAGSTPPPATARTQ